MVNTMVNGAEKGYKYRWFELNQCVKVPDFKQDEGNPGTSGRVHCLRWHRHCHVPETSTFGDPIVTLAATPTASGATINYAFTAAGNPDSVGDIGMTTGEITLATPKSIDYETTTSIIQNVYGQVCCVLLTELQQCGSGSLQQFGSGSLQQYGMCVADGATDQFGNEFGSGSLQQFGQVCLQSGSLQQYGSGSVRLQQYGSGSLQQYGVCVADGAAAVRGSGSLQQYGSGSLQQHFFHLSGYLCHGNLQQRCMQRCGDAEMQRCGDAEMRRCGNAESVCGDAESVCGNAEMRRVSSRARLM
ncbi:hypothetical protein DPMN_144965 [Dreissena polymorpha]|uniref:Uncharacterized protein n=1 Tax=Dreissena polymorpha TaxID=45954 RepID=A0A9D4J0J3_DREPO|nr:hypothetical protein DPMN_144965 [Dreissena polymorpha]